MIFIFATVLLGFSLVALQDLPCRATRENLKEAGLTAAVKHLSGLWTRGGTPNGLSASPSYYARKQDLQRGSE